MEELLKKYLKKILEVSKRGDAREESYYFALQELLEAYAEHLGKTRIHITALPKKTEAGNPDFRIWDGKQKIVGYIEAKTPTVDNLDRIEATEQLKRYLNTFPNLILTNFFEFRLYRDGSMIDSVQIARPFIIHKLKTIPPVEKESGFLSLLEKHLSFSLPKVYSSKNLAVELAKRTKFLKDEVVAEELKEEEAGGKGFILGFYEAFKKYLISGLTKEDFADLYSQTITYGLFAARTRSENGFNRKLAYDNIPRTIGILRDVFKFISLEDLPRQMEWIIDDISEVLAVTDVKQILHQYFHEGKGKDPIVHFYETFLAEYDPKMRGKRGVYYTPEPVVSYVVRSLHSILKKHFNRADGFAHESVTVLDPAAGTLTFLAEAAKVAVEEFVSKYGEVGRGDFIKEHILKNFYAFELMMAPYAVGHLKMSFFLEELGYKLQKGDRFKLFLTNALEMEELAQTELPGMASLSEESHLASKVKKEQPILAILGNPPYSVSSYNHSDFIEDIMGLYKDDVKNERNIQLLSDDYAKFIRLCHWKLEQMGSGVIGLVTKNTYLSVSAFKGMRKKLIEFFDEIYVLNLHGKLYEKTPDGNKDENVFDIRVGTAIVLMIKSNRKKSKYCKLYYSNCWGEREEKYNFLNSKNIDTTEWEEVKKHSEYFFFEKKEFKYKRIYDSFIQLDTILLISSSGITTHRDHFILADSIVGLKNRLQAFLTSNLPLDLLRQAFSLNDTDNFKLIRVKKRFTEVIDSKLKDYCYKPFHDKFIYYDSQLIDRDRYKIMRNFLSGDNLGLIIKKRHKNKTYQHVFISDTLVDKNYLGGQTYVFPLFLYNDLDKKDLFDKSGRTKKRQPNISIKIITTISDVYKKEVSPENIFYYIYAILYSNAYRTKYSEFLKIDFPRIPFTDNYRLFKKISDYGKRLSDLHLLKSKELDPPVAKFQGKGKKEVGKLIYDEKEKRIYFNQNQYIDGITKELWHYQIGGYQVCDKWLKDKKGKTLSLRDIKHYCKVVTSIKRTIETQAEIDKIYPKIEENIIELETND